MEEHMWFVNNRKIESAPMKNNGLVKPNSSFELQVNASYHGRRLDTFLTEQFPLYSRSFFSRLIDDGHISINKKSTTKSGAKLKEGDLITVTFPGPREIQEKALRERDLPIEVLFEHPHFMIIYKPAGLLVHPPSMKSTAATLVDWLLVNHATIEDVGYVDRPGIVHRLDKDTSGILIVPRTNYAHTVFGNLFRERSINKTYYAIVQGHPDKSGTINLAIGRDQIARTKMTTKKVPMNFQKMRNAVTHYKVIEYFNDAALVEVKPVTGRTHQIRVHFAAIGHPLVGDPVYGSKLKNFKRQALHAHSLSFMFEGKEYTFEKEMPDDMLELIKELRNNPKIV